MKYRKKAVVIEAITFDEFVEYGRRVADGLVNGMPWHFEYMGHPISHENDECYLIPTLEGIHNMTPADMLITGVKGEIYPCKKDIFEMTYEMESYITGLMSFGQAVQLLKEGGKLARLGWNGKGMFLYHVPAGRYPARTTAAKSHFGEGVLVPYHAYIAMKTADNMVVPWLASQTDILAEDWVLVQ